MMEQPALVVEAEQQRAHTPIPGFVPEAADHTVGRAQVLDLQHGAFSRQVGEIEPLRHYSVDLNVVAARPAIPRAFLQIAGERRQQQPLAAILLPRRQSRRRPGAPRTGDREAAGRACFSRQSNRMRLAGVSRAKLLHAALAGGMKAHLQGVERRRPVDRENKLSVQHERARRKGSKVRNHFRKEPRQRLAGLRLDLDLVARPEREAPEPVPLGFELPARTVRQLGRRYGLPSARATMASRAYSGWRRVPLFGGSLLPDQPPDARREHPRSPPCQNLIPRANFLEV